MLILPALPSSAKFSTALPRSGGQDADSVPGLEQQRRLVTGRPVDAAAIDHIESVLGAVAEHYEAFGPRAVLDIRQSQAALVDALLPDCHAPLLPRLITVRASLARVPGFSSAQPVSA
jgi:hypothetical protein